MKIECDECSAFNDPGLSRCHACGSLLPVTLALDGPTFAEMEEAARAPEYRQRRSAGTRNRPRPSMAPTAAPPVAGPRRPAREVPFDVEDDWEDDVFTSATGTPGAAAPEEDAERPAASLHPLPSGPLAYVPGKGLVPKSETQRPAPKRPASPKTSTRKRPATPQGPPPVPAAKKRPPRPNTGPAPVSPGGPRGRAEAGLRSGVRTARGPAGNASPGVSASGAANARPAPAPVDAPNAGRSLPEPGSVSTVPIKVGGRPAGPNEQTAPRAVIPADPEATLIVAGAPQAPPPADGELAALGALFDPPEDASSAPEHSTPRSELPSVDDSGPVRLPPVPPPSRPGRRGHSANLSPQTEVAIAVPVQSVKLARLDAAGGDVEVRVLEHGRFLIGREDGDILLGDDTVSPWHAQISVRRNGVFLRDMRSLNGVFVSATGDVQLQDGALVRAGTRTLRYRDRWDEVAPDRHGTAALGGPRPPKATRVELLGPGGVITAVHYVADTLLLGRTRGDVRFAEDADLEAEHARFQVRDGVATVTPVSEGRTFVQISQEVELPGGAVFLVGNTVFRVDF